MQERTHNDLNAKVRAIVDEAIAELLMLGMDGAESAAKLMAVQAIVRIDDPKGIAEIADFAESLIDREGGD